MKHTEGLTVLEVVLASGQWEVIPKDKLLECKVMIHQLAAAGMAVPSGVWKIIPLEMVDLFDL